MSTFWRFLLSLKTAFGLFIAAIAVCIVGSLALPANLAFFSGIDDTPLFAWLSEAGNTRLTWWIYAMIAVMGLMALSTVICTLDALLRLRGENLLSKLSPQVMHLGILLVLFGHLLSSSMGTKSDLQIKKGERKPLSAWSDIYLNDITVETDPAGYYTGWSAELWLYEGDRKASEKLLRPARPVYVDGQGLFFKSISMEGEPTALIMVSRDPGAIWALAGGILASLGGIGFVYSRARG